MDGDPVLARLRERKEFFEFAAGALQSDAAFFFVLNPDQLSVNETRRAIGEMADNDLAVRGIVANRLTPEPDDDENGRGARYLRDRVATETERLAEVRETLTPPLVAEITTRTAEVKGSLLEEVAAELDVETTVEAPTFVG
jgi:arsenite-transporting ATPase